MTTYELPSEPPVGSRVKDAEGNIWERIPSSSKQCWTRTNHEYVHSWSAMLTVVAPLTLIEPNQRPTDPLIVADWTSESGQQGGRGLLYRETDADQYWTIRENEYPEYTGDTLNNVVPVTVVPVAEMEALRASIKALGYGPESTRSAGSLLDTALRLLAATDMLGVDL